LGSLNRRYECVTICKAGFPAFLIFLVGVLKTYFVSRCFHIAVLFALLSLFLSPLLPNHVSPWLSFSHELLAILSVLFLLCAYLIAGKRLQIKKITIVAFVIALIPLIQCYADIHYFMGDALIASAYLMLVCLALSLGVSFSYKYNQQTIIKCLAYVFLFSSIVSVYLSICQWLEINQLGVFQYPIKDNARPYANLASFNRRRSCSISY